MRFRWTIKELDEATDDEILRSIVVERQSDLSISYSPFYKRLAEIKQKLTNRIEHESSNRT